MSSDSIIGLLGSKEISITVTMLIIGSIVRLSKGDVPWFPTVPSRWRPVLSIALGVLVAALYRVVLHGSLNDALILGAVTGLGPIVGHDVIVHALLGGKEPPVPFIKKPSPPEPAEPAAPAKSESNETNETNRPQPK